MEKETPNNIIELKKYQEIQETITNAIDQAMKEIGFDAESEFKIYSTIYQSLCETLAKEFASQGHWEEGSPDFDSKKSSMLLYFSFSDRNFAEFLDFLQKRVAHIPTILKEKITTYIGEHDNFLDSPAAKIDSHGIQIISDSETIPTQPESILDIEYKEGEFEKLKNLEFTLKKRLRDLLNIV